MKVIGCIEDGESWSMIDLQDYHFIVFEEVLPPSQLDELDVSNHKI